MQGNAYIKRNGTIPANAFIDTEDQALVPGGCILYISNRIMKICVGVSGLFFSSTIGFLWTIRLRTDSQMSYLD